MDVRPLLVVLLALALVGAACGAQEEEEPAAPPDPPAEPEPEPPAEPEEPPEEPVEEPPPEPDADARDEGPEPIALWGIDDVQSDDFPREDEDAYLVDVRFSQHEAGEEHPEFDRVVLEFAEVGPSWSVAWEEPPIVEDPSGRELDVAGGAFLRVSLHPASGVDMTGDEPRDTYDGPDRLEVDGVVVTEVVRTTDHHRALGWVLALEREAPFAVELLQDPPRLVIDVVDE